MPARTPVLDERTSPLFSRSRARTHAVKDRDPKKLVPTHPRPTQKRKDKSLCQAQTGRRDGWSSCVFLLFVYIYSRMLTASAKLSSSEQSAAQALREEVAPVLANGVACAMRDQPSDPAGYMAEYLAVAGAGGAASVLDQRKFGQECARLDAELIAEGAAHCGARRTVTSAT